MGCATQPSIVVQSNDRGCWSLLGKAKGVRSQLLNLGQGCGVMGMAAHQLSHALGMTHEYARGDRDTYLEIKAINTNTTLYGLQFNLNSDKSAYSGITFDFLSLMMPGSSSFTENGEYTILAKQEPALYSSLLGQRMGLSELDVMRLSEKYGCLKQAKARTKSAQLAELILSGCASDKSGNCKDAADTSIGANGVSGGRSCSELAEDGLCDSPYYSSLVKSRCPASCFQCLPGLGQEESACEDGADTGIQFRNGSHANCWNLKGYCKTESIIGAKVRESCRRSCGQCALEVCEDFAANLAPTFESDQGGRLLTCTELASRCGMDEKVKDKCKATCGACAPTAIDQATEKWKKMLNDEVYAKAEQFASCVRRRRFGLCSTRRRGAGTTKADEDLEGDA